MWVRSRGKIRDWHVEVMVRSKGYIKSAEPGSLAEKKNVFVSAISMCTKFGIHLLYLLSVRLRGRMHRGVCFWGCATVENLSHMCEGGGLGCVCGRNLVMLPSLSVCRLCYRNRSHQWPLQQVFLYMEHCPLLEEFTHCKLFQTLSIYIWTNIFFFFAGCIPSTVQWKGNVVQH